MTTYRNKLNDHIVYLQNEVRKRDELLETSEFGDSNFELVDYEDDSVIAAEDESTHRAGDIQSNRGELEIGGNASGSKDKRKKKTLGHMLQQTLEDTRA